MILRLAPLVLVAFCADVADFEDRGVAPFIEVVRANRALDLDAAFAEARKVAGEAVTLQQAEYPDGHREWLVFRTHPSLEKHIRAKMGPVTGRGFGDEDGWLLPFGGLILQRNGSALELIYAPGPAENALEDLSRPQLSLHGGELLHSPSSSRPVGVRIRSNATATRCVAEGNLFIVEEPGVRTVWRRPFAMWNGEIQQGCVRP